MKRLSLIPSLVNVIHILETVAAQYVRHEIHVHSFACMQFQCIISQLLTRYHFFGERIRIGHHAKPFFSFLQAAQHFCAEYFVCRILLPVLDGTTERGRKKRHLLRPQYLRQIMIEITGFLHIAQNENERTGSPLNQHRRKQRSGRGT